MGENIKPVNVRNKVIAAQWRERKPRNIMIYTRRKTNGHNIKASGTEKDFT